jgi:hypothetical protein
MARDLFAEYAVPKAQPAVQKKTPRDLFSQDQTRFEKQNNALQGFYGFMGGAHQRGVNALEGIVNAPADLYQYVTGREGYKIPHAEVLLDKYTNEGPINHPRKLGQKIGSIANDAALSAALMPILPFAPGTRLLDVAANTGLSGLYGAAEGALTNEGDRARQAKYYGLGGLAAGGLGFTAQKLNNTFVHNISDDVLREANRLQTTIGNNFNAPLEEAERLGANALFQIPQPLQTRRGAEQYINQLLPDITANEKRYLAGFQEFLTNPTARNLHTAQSEIGQLLRRYNTSGLTHDRNIADNVFQLQQQLRAPLGQAIEHTAGPEARALYEGSRQPYAEYMQNYGNNPNIQRALANPRSGPAQKALVNDLMNNTDFLTNVGHNHTGLQDRRMIKNIYDHPLTSAGVKAAAAAGASFGVPYYIRQAIKDSV